MRTARYDDTISRVSQFCDALKVHSAKHFLPSVSVYSRKFASFLKVSSMYLQYGYIQCHSIYGAKTAFIKWIWITVEIYCRSQPFLVLTFVIGDEVVRLSSMCWSGHAEVPVLCSWFCLCHTLVRTCDTGEPSCSYIPSIPFQQSFSKFRRLLISTVACFRRWLNSRQSLESMMQRLVLMFKMGGGGGGLLHCAQKKKN
jgi:hypothetical protein